MGMTEQATLAENKQVVEGFIQAINKRDLDKLSDYVAPDVIDHNKIIYGEADEPGAAFEGFRQQLAAFDPFSMHIEELIAENDRVVARIRQRAVHSGYHPRMPQPTGKSSEIEAIFIFTVKNKKISEIRAVSDRLGFFLQLGWDWPEND